MRWVVLFLLTVWLTPARGDEVSFRGEVMPILSRTGCNQGACHGNLNGKGGFRLSLRGESPRDDLASLTREMLARRTDVNRPEESLILRKATGSVPHEGGPRFSRDSREYQLLRDWIAQGCRDRGPLHPAATGLEVTPRRQILFDPVDRTQIRVVANLADGTRRDVTHLASFETTAVGIVDVLGDGTVRRQRFGELNVLVRYLDFQIPVTLAFLPERREFAWPRLEPANKIDRLAFPLLKELRLTPSPLADDSTFLRRLFIDALGILPTEAEAREFLRETSPDKRSRWIDAVLARPEFADHWAQKWGDLLRNEEKSLDRKGVRVFHHWLREWFENDRPLDQLAREIISARGSTYQNPPANLYRSLRDPYSRAESVAQVFLGLRLQCARCHNHPFDRWTQDDYHQFAAIFGRVGYRILENKRRDQLDSHEFDGEQIVFLAREGGPKHPRTQLPLIPKLPGERELPARTDPDPMQVLADWVGTPENPYFARAQANRIWYHLVGRGLVDPIDDFRTSNPAENEALLDALSEHLQKHRFSLKSLARLILNSHTYQFSSSPLGTNVDDERHFARGLVRPLQAEQLLDALAQVTGSRPKFEGYPAGTRAGELAAVSQERRGRRSSAPGAEQFLKGFGKPDRLLTCECERSEDLGVSQASQLLAGELLQGMLADPNNHLASLLQGERSEVQIVESLYLSALARFPTTEEADRLSEYLARASNRRGGLEDIAWALVNSKEFLLRR